MGIIKFVVDDFKRMSHDFHDLFTPPRHISAEEFIAEFEARQEQETKEQALKRLGLDRLPCHLTMDDLIFDTANEKYDTLKKYIVERKKFEDEWK